MNATRERQLKRQLADLRAEYRDWTSGRALTQRGRDGLPWCDHRVTDPHCEGCGTRMWAQDQARPLVAEAALIKAELDTSKQVTP